MQDSIFEQPQAGPEGARYRMYRVIPLALGGINSERKPTPPLSIKTL